VDQQLPEQVFVLTLIPTCNASQMAARHRGEGEDVRVVEG
jgi:hypothetical protein